MIARVEFIKARPEGLHLPPQGRPARHQDGPSGGGCRCRATLTLAGSMPSFRWPWAGPTAICTSLRRRGRSILTPASTSPSSRMTRKFSKSAILLFSRLPRATKSASATNTTSAIRGNMRSRSRRFCLPTPRPLTIALCLEGARACPPEDCGGVWGYANLLEILKNRKHQEHRNHEGMGRCARSMPEAFDLAKVNTLAAELKWPRVTEAQLRKVLMGRDGIRHDRRSL